MLYVLFVLLAGLGWGLWFILRFSHWIAVGVSGGMVLAIILTFILKRVFASRAASGLERALADQGRQQAMNANPQRRGEIQAMQEQISAGIKALKDSKLGGKKRGRSALYALPWYAIIGPPGAGKTTALRHSGLVFPFADSAVRGVGGTRNCDWWFTNEAILLDTAGRYATEASDQGEWLAFLDLLRKYRGNKPLNGLLVAVAIPDIIDANEQQLDAMATKLRTRIDEVMTRLRMVLPVYLIITKCDLVAGFVEFFGNMRKSERVQPWGATFDLKEDKQNPGAIFLREFDTLVAGVHGRACGQLVAARDRKTREAIYQFPLEFSGVRRNLHALVARVFAPNAFHGTPIFRGFYFTSGTQEGLPMNRVLERMGQAMGIRPMQLGQMPVVESKSYFLHDVFMRVVFPDAEVAGRSAGEVRRQKIVRFGVGGLALAVALTFCVPSILSYFKNRDLLDDTRVRAEKAAKIEWKRSGNLNSKLLELTPVLERLRELDTHEESVPLELGFLMYKGDQLSRPLVRVFIANMQQGFVTPCRFYLEDRLKTIEGKDYWQERHLLKTYLMLSDVKELDVDWATGVFTALWVELNKPSGGQSIYDLKQQAEPFVRYYFELIRDTKTRKARAKAVEANERIVAHARSVLAKVEPSVRYQALFVEGLRYELWDPSGEVVPTNQHYPPLTLLDLFDDRPEVLEKVTSKQHRETKKWFEVDGVFTDVGHFGVLVNLAEAEKVLRSERWVVPLDKDEEREGGIEPHLAKVAADYETAYIAAWEAFLADLYVVTPGNLKEAADLHKLLLEPERPYIRVIRNLEEHTHFSRDLEKVAKARASKIVVKKRNTEAERRARGKQLDIDPQQIVGRKSRMPTVFDQLVHFGIARRGQPLSATPLAKYGEILERLRAAILRTLDDRPDAPVESMDAEIKQAVRETEALLGGLDARSRELLAPLLLTPLNVGGKYVASR